MMSFEKYNVIKLHEENITPKMKSEEITYTGFKGVGLGTFNTGFTSTSKSTLFP